MGPKFLSGKLNGGDHFENVGADNIQTDLTEIGCVEVDWI
jgi:hypothetical protein